MIARGLILFAALAVLPAAAAPLQLAQAAVPTLDRAVLVYATVDQQEIYLGEAVTLTLELWELKFRGVKIQSRYRGGGPVMPDMEGFYGGEIQTEHEDATRDGALYGVTRHRQRLYPAVAGDLEIGAWSWTGTVRGHTATGARSVDLDLSTNPLRVRVMPLPEPPSTFRGAVGEFQMSLALSSPELSQGVPASIAIEMSGIGNPGTLQAPVVPEASWFELGAAKETEDPSVDPASGAFTKLFHYDLMPLSPGEFTFPAVSFTYFSPDERRYKILRTSPESVKVAAAGPAEQLVVVGSIGVSGAGVAAMDHGKLALAGEIDVFSIRRERPYLWPVLFAVPPFAFLTLIVVTGRWRVMMAWPRRRPRLSSIGEGLAELQGHPNAPDALAELVNGAITAHIGVPVPGLSVPEIEKWLAERLADGHAQSIAAVLRECQDLRYGKRILSPGDMPALIERARTALAPLEAPSRRWGWLR